ncbi:MAG: universal stress protein [Bacteroidota bacterium]
MPYLAALTSASHLAMLKRILVALDFDSDTSVATRYAIDIAQRSGAEVTGLALVDRKGAEDEATGAGLGAMYYAEKLQHELSAEARAQAQDLIRAFAAELDRAGVRHGRDHVEEGVPFERIVEDMKYHDLLVGGHESHFFYPDRDKRTHAMNEVVEKGAAATLIVQPTHRPVRRVLVAYDRSVSAARAMQKFAQLDAFGAEHVEVEIVNVRADNDDARAESELMLGLATSYFEAHGFSSVAGTSLPGSTPKDLLLDHADRTGADLIVAGSHAKAGLSKFLFGSTATGFIEEATLPLFLYH